jgi:glutathione synthase/RimK-type ligase-like ATP-grasp enzyme
LPTIALVSAREALALDEDLPPLIEALRRAGAQVEVPCWDDAAVDWSHFDLALLRSTWDYVERIDEFLDWAKRCAAATVLLNSPEVVAWNTDKHYLTHLHRAGVEVVPSRFVEPGEAVEAALDDFLTAAPGTVTAGHAAAFEQFVVKPSIGAGSRDAARYRRTDRDQALAHLRRLVTVAGRSALLQPYLERVDHAGETALIYFGGEPSHAIRKGPLLRLDEGLVAGLFAPEDISPREPDAQERELAAKAYAALPFAPPLYARIDMIRADDGTPMLLELEMTEPSLFFAHAPDSADRLARLVVRRCAATG